MVNRRVERTERPRDEGVYSSRTEKDKKGHEKFSSLPEDKAREKGVMLATFLSALKKIFEQFGSSKGLAGKVADLQKIIEDLTAFKEKFKLLSQKDLSQSPDFATSLSDLWIRLVEDQEFIAIYERKKEDKESSFSSMLATLKEYPKDSEHSLGYYLTRHAGKDWLPTPFMEILKNLHDDHQKNKKASTLTGWFDLIDKVIHNLKSAV